jgi:hypothetical protein
MSEANPWIEYQVTGQSIQIDEHRRVFLGKSAHGGYHLTLTNTENPLQDRQLIGEVAVTNGQQTSIRISDEALLAIFDLALHALSKDQLSKAENGVLAS